MLFRNLKSGNLVEATSETSIALMQRSPNYEAVAPAPDTPAECIDTPSEAQEEVREAQKNEDKATRKSVKKRR